MPTITLKNFNLVMKRMELSKMPCLINQIGKLANIQYR